MVGDDARFDFVVFEYYSILVNNEARLVDLAKRVRTRFPDALIIFMSMEDPGFYRYKPTGESVQEVLARSGTEIMGGLYEGITEQEMLNATWSHTNEDWELKVSNFQLQKSHIEEAADAVGGVVWSPVTWHRGDTRLTMLQQVRVLGRMYFKGKFVGQLKLQWRIKSHFVSL